MKSSPSLPFCEHPLHAVSYSASFLVRFVPPLNDGTEPAALFGTTTPTSASGATEKQCRPETFEFNRLTFMLCSISMTRRRDHAFPYSAKSLLFLCSEDRRANIFPSSKMTCIKVPLLPSPPLKQIVAFC